MKGGSIRSAVRGFDLVMGKGNDMRSVKAFISVVLVAVFTLGVVSCGKAGESKETQKKFSKEEFYGTGYYVIAGKSPDWADEKEIRLKYYHESGVDAVWWKHDPADYEYGDIFIANGIEPGYREVEFYQQTIQEMVLDSNVQLEKVGNCKDLMTLRKAKITDVSYAGYEFWDVSLKYLDNGATNGYNFRNNAAYYVEITSAEPGDIYLFACLGDVPVIPMEKVK